MFQRSEPQKLMSLEKCDGTDGTVGKVSAMSVISETVAEIREAATCLKLDAKRRLPVNCCGHSKHKGIHQNPILAFCPGRCAVELPLSSQRAGGSRHGTFARWVLRTLKYTQYTEHEIRECDSRWNPMALRLCFQKDLSCQAVFYALQTDLGLSLSDLATMTLIQAENLPC